MGREESAKEQDKGILNLSWRKGAGREENSNNKNDNAIIPATNSERHEKDRESGAYIEVFSYYNKKSFFLMSLVGFTTYEEIYKKALIEYFL